MQEAKTAKPVKVTHQNEAGQGKIQDSTKGQVKLKGAPTPKSMGEAGYPHKLKALEEQIFNRVLQRLLEAAKKAKKKSPKKEMPAHEKQGAVKDDKSGSKKKS